MSHKIQRSKNHFFFSKWHPTGVQKIKVKIKTENFVIPKVEIPIVEKSQNNDLEASVNICSLCGDNFSTSSELTCHISSPHTSPCFQCDSMFVTFESLRKHMEQLHSPHKSQEKLIETSKPTKSIPKKIQRVKVEALKEMFIIKDVENLIKIDQELIHKANDRILPPQETQKQNAGFECKSCPLKFENERKLFNHAILAHSENWKYEDRTKKWKKGPMIDSPTPKGPFRCLLCDESIKTWTQLSKHLWSPHLFQCNHCDKSFTRDTSLEDHVNKDHDWLGLVDDTVCTKCGEVFSRSSTLARHIGIPHNHACDLCDLRFQNKKLLMKHRKICVRSFMNHIIDDCMSCI